MSEEIDIAGVTTKHTKMEPRMNTDGHGLARDARSWLVCAWRWRAQEEIPDVVPFRMDRTLPIDRLRVFLQARSWCAKN